MYALPRTRAFTLADGASLQRVHQKICLLRLLVALYHRSFAVMGWCTGNACMLAGLRVLLYSLRSVLCSGGTADVPARAVSVGARRVHLPAVVHATLAADAARPRTIVVGDVHGCIDELRDLLRACVYSKSTDRVVLVGDLVNKGPSSVECVRLAREEGFLATRGNHDDSALFA